MRIIDSKCRRVYIGAMEPAHFQICEGVRIMQEAGIDVIRLTSRVPHCICLPSVALSKCFGGTVAEQRACKRRLPSLAPLTRCVLLAQPV